MTIVFIQLQPNLTRHAVTIQGEIDLDLFILLCTTGGPSVKAPSGNE